MTTYLFRIFIYFIFISRTLLGVDSVTTPSIDIQDINTPSSTIVTPLVAIETASDYTQDSAKKIVEQLRENGVLDKVEQHPENLSPESIKAIEKTAQDQHLDPKQIEINMINTELGKILYFITSAMLSNEMIFLANNNPSSFFEIIIATMSQITFPKEESRIKSLLLSILMYRVMCCMLQGDISPLFNPLFTLMKSFALTMLLNRNLPKITTHVGFAFHNKITELIDYLNTFSSNPIG